MSEVHKGMALNRRGSQLFGLFVQYYTDLCISREQQIEHQSSRCF